MAGQLSLQLLMMAVTSFIFYASTIPSSAALKSRFRKPAQPLPFAALQSMG